MNEREIELLLDRRDVFLGRKLRKEIQKVTDDTISDLKLEVANTIELMMGQMNELARRVKQLEND